MRISNSSVLLNQSQDSTNKQSKKKQALEKMRQSWIDFLSNFPDDMPELNNNESPLPEKQNSEIKNNIDN